MSSRQSDMRFTLVFSDVGNDRPPPTFEVLAFQLDEGLSECFRLAVELSSADATVDFGKVLDQTVLFTLWYGEQAVRYVHGVVSEFSQHESGFRRTFYHAVVEPALAHATLRSDWKIFQQQTVPQILQMVLKRSGISDVEQTLTKEHLPREYCVQPGETDLDFFQRLSAEEGLYYAFTHSATGHRLVQGDRLYVHGAIDGVVTYNSAPGGDQAVPCLRTFRYAEHDRTETVGNDEQVTIGRNRSHQIGQDATLIIERNHTITVGKDRMESVGNHRKDQTGANHLIDVGGHVEATVQGHHKLSAGQSIEGQTQRYQLQAGDKAVIRGPGGTITLDSSGVTLEGVAIHFKGPISKEDGGPGHALHLNGTPIPGLSPDDAHLPLSE